jgi:hypothetical protein
MRFLPTPKLTTLLVASEGVVTLLWVTLPILFQLERCAGQVRLDHDDKLPTLSDTKARLIFHCAKSSVNRMILQDSSLVVI